MEIDITEEPQKDLKNFRMNVLPAVTSCTEMGKLPIVVGLLRKKDDSDMSDCSSEAKRELVIIRDINLMQTLPDPKMDRILLYYVDRFKLSYLIISQIAEGKSSRPHVNMMYEQLRLRTLRTYSRNNKLFLTKYAAAGFYYASDGDGVVCYCFGIRRYKWVEADDPMEVHKRINPRCKCFINNSEHNFPAIADGLLRQTVARLDMIPDCIRAQSPGENVYNSQGTRTGFQLAISKHPHMAIKTVREQSFNGNWSNTPKYSPLQLSDGGFYFTDELSNYLYNKHLRQAYQSIRSESIYATREIKNGIDSAEEKPRTDLKNLRTNVLPAVTSSTEIGKLPIVETFLRKKDNSEISDCRSEAKRQLAMIRDIILMQTLPDPKMDRIFLYYVDRFNPLNLIFCQISEVKLPRPQVTMRYDLLSLCTLRTQKRVLSTLRRDNKLFLTKYASAGFYYASDGDDVVCYCCGIRRYGWVEAGDPMEVHKRINPRCKFIINNSEHNVPAIADGPLRQTVARLDMIPDCIRAPSREEDVNNSQGTRTDEPSNYLYNNHLRKAYQSVCNESILATREIKNGIDSAEEKDRYGNLNQLKIVYKMKTYKGLSDELRKRTGIDRLRPAKCSKVCYPVTQIITQPIVHQIDMRYELRRFSTFDTYPPDNKPFSSRFAAAGFYYTGDGDAVVCFCCGIRRDGWVKRDAPMVVHRNINPGCQFVINNCDLNVPAVVQMPDRRRIAQLEAIPYCSQDCGHGDPVHSCGQGVYPNSVYSVLVCESAQRAVNAGYSAEQVRDIIIYHRGAHGHQIETMDQILETASEMDLNIPNLPLAAVDHGSDVPASNQQFNDKSKDICPFMFRGFGDTSNEVSSAEETSSNRPYNNDPEDIKLENEQLKEQTLCKVCLDNIVSIVFLPCGHLVTCADCAPALRKCPICRADVKGTVRTRVS